MNWRRLTRYCPSGASTSASGAPQFLALLQNLHQHFQRPPLPPQRVLQPHDGDHADQGHHEEQRQRDPAADEQAGEERIESQIHGALSFGGSQGDAGG
jgi:hypothetical protein